jgi:hypothetical protein
MLGKMFLDNSQQLTVFVNVARDTSFGVGAAWKEHSGWKTKAWSLCKYLTKTDAVSFGVDMVVESLLSMLEETDHRYAVITSIASHTRRIEDEGGRVVLTWLADDRDKEGYKTAGAVAQRAAKQQPKEMRSTSLWYVKQAVRRGGKPRERSTSTSRTRRGWLPRGTYS